MQIYFYLEYREGKQYMCIVENNTGKEHEIFLGSADETHLPENFIGTLEIQRKIPEKEKMIGLIGKALISIRFKKFSQSTEVFEEEVKKDE